MRLPRRKLFSVANRRDQGFTLLELLIVLALLAGIMALAWPNLRKPFGQTPLKQSAATIRELLDECRYQATLRGELTLLHLQRNSSELQLGSWQELLHERLAEQGSATVEPLPATDTRSSPSSDSLDKNAAPSGRPLKRQWVLPEPIVVQQVLWTSADPLTATDSETSPSDSNLSNLKESQTALSSQKVAGEEDLASSWYVPFLPSGQSRDLSIVLLDSQTQKRLMVRHRQGNGLIDIIQLPDAETSGTESLESPSSFEMPPTNDDLSPQR